MTLHLPLALIALAAVGCGGAGAEPATAPPPEPAPAASAEQPALEEWMRTHFVEGRGIRDALVRGELPSAKARLADLGRQPSPADVPAEWEPHLESLRGAAGDAAEAEALAAVAVGFARFAAQCADCHRAADAAPSFASPDLAPAEGDAPAPMERHQWAAEAMWQGLVAPAPDRYRQGAEVLAAAPLHPAELVVGDAPPLDVVQAAEQARDVAGRASRAETDDARAELYGELLATCAGCHGQL